MANGDYLTIDELRNLSKPINDIKGIFDEYALSMGAEIIYHSRGWVGVELKWENQSQINCVVQLSLDNDRVLYNLAVGGFKYISNNYYYKSHRLKEGIEPPFESQSILNEMTVGVELGNSWTIDDLYLISNYSA